MENLLIKNAAVVWPGQPQKKLDILISGGRYQQIGENIQPEDVKVINASGLTVSPGLMDMHVHLREPGYTYKEDIASGCAAAARGGFTAVCAMPNTKPVVDSPTVLEQIYNKAASAKARVYQSACITQAMEGQALCDFAALKKAGAAAFSDDGRPVKNAALMQRAIGLAKQLELPIISHCEDLDIIDGGIINKGVVSECLGVKGMDRSSEDSITAREIALAMAEQAPVHIAHVSTYGSLEFIRAAKANGHHITCETAPHYFLFNHTSLLARDANFRMNPPLRTEQDRKAVIEAICDGTVDCIVTDHAPHSKKEKEDFEKAPNGIIGLETSFSASYTALVKPGLISLEKLIDLMSTRPREIMHLCPLLLKPGEIADLVLYNPAESWTVREEELASKASNTPFLGETLDLKVKYTICGGEITYADKKETP